MPETSLNNFLVAPLKKLDMVELFKQALEQNQDVVFSLNNQQLDRGIRADGSSLGRYKNFKYKNRWEPVDLKLTGEFRRKETLQEGNKNAEVFSQDQKNDMLVKKYGKDIFGISKQYQPNLAEAIEKTLGELIKKQLGIA